MNQRNLTQPTREMARALTGVVVMAVLLAGCAHTPVARNDIPVLRYTGSSTIAHCGHVKVLPVDGQHPSPSNPDYPISRPLYLLWWPGRTQTAEFISWTQTPDARVILMKRFAVPHTESASPVQGGAQ